MIWAFSLSRRILASTFALLAWGISPNAVSHAQQPRHFAPKLWAPMWYKGGTINDDTFGWIREHVVDSTQVLVLDAGGLQIHALDILTGRLLWSVGHRGAGPGEFLAPSDIALTRDGFAVLDPGNGRVSLYSRHGVHIDDVANPKLSNGRALCMRPDGSMIVHIGWDESFLVQLDRTGRQSRQWAFPWRDADLRNPLLVSANTVRGGVDGECHFATTFGFGLIRIDSYGNLRTSPFVEKYPKAEFVERTGSSGRKGIYLEKGFNASMGGTRWRDTLAIHASSATGQIIGFDLYDARSGAYLASWRVPGDDRLAMYNGMLINLSASSVTQRIRAWADTADTTRVFKQIRQRLKDQERNPTPPRRSDTRARPPAPARVPPPASR